ncbi:MAG: septum formation initiator family protein [Candidatus Shapirobacteria bacterium]|jgi:cell division protein FtsB|nr:septum formation initiator family protein [Candidatus Shapirobacteria bacterium]
MKKFFLILLGLVITGSIISNITTQFGTLKEAKKQNIKIEKEINNLSQKNQILKQKIEYATSSAFIDQQAHEKFGMGRENDVWLKLNKEENLDLFPKTNENKEIPKIRQWIKLFTQ